MNTSATTRDNAYHESLPRHGTQAGDVLDYLRQRGFEGATRREIADGLNIERSSVCGRVRPMLDSGAIVDSGKERAGLYGKSNHVLLAKEFACKPDHAITQAMADVRAKQATHQLNLF